ncbi:DUF1707 SHOCT-like domain-containing protein [Actinocatenispora rupis]|uniref:Cell wall-active antibiotics response 4TMS YvqF n=1 Tax=Actinocatenispora rupis TaxID=519421 RepID=A0A8J3IZR4_9ACTN|nr:DUF1707 domain-containing protein [Actinocatenispora rupis]GID13091.1 hypothetical protein Aru02nite_39800 [Actinocatenispora rupis]
MEPERVIRPVPAPAVTDDEREAAVELLQRACGEGRMTLEEFSERAGVAWAAESREELATVTEGLSAPPPVGTSQPVSDMSAIFSEHKQYGRWRLPRRMRIRSIFGASKIDLREATIDAEAVRDGVVDITVRVLFGEVKLIVPEGVEVEMYGGAVFGSRKASLNPVPRRQGTPTVRLHCKVTFGELKVSSAPIGQRDRVDRLFDRL